MRQTEHIDEMKSRYIELKSFSNERILLCIQTCLYEESFPRNLMKFDLALRESCGPMLTKIIFAPQLLVQTSPFQI
jgi:hypothetical protein